MPATAYAPTLAGMVNLNTEQMDRIRIIIPLILFVACSTFGQRVDSLGTFEGTITYLDKAPAPTTGNEKYLDWIDRNNKLKYLSDTLTIHDKAYVEFFVDTTGQVIDVKIHRGIGAPYDREAVRLIAEHPHNRWEPAEQQGKKLKTRFVLPIYFVDKQASDRRKKKRGD
jgi:hypothetical protein